MGTSSCFHVTEVEEIKRIIGEAMYENEVVGPNGSPVSGGGSDRYGVVMLGDSITEYQTAKKTISALSQSGGIATATCTGHGLSSGYQSIVGAVQQGYNGRRLITVTGANSFTFPVDPATISPATTTSLIAVMTQHRMLDTSWFSYANAKLGGRLQLIWNAGRGGYAAWQFDPANSSFLADDVLVHECEEVIVELGRNDITQGRSIPKIITALTNIYEAILATGRRVGAVTIQPVISGHVAYSVRNATRENQVNAWIRRYVLTRKNMRLVDSAKLIQDPAGYGARANYLNGVDFVHPTPLGARLGYGEALAAAYADVQPWSSLPTSAYDAHVLQRQTITGIVQAGGIATATLTGHGYLSGEYVHIYGAGQAGYNGLKLITTATSNTFNFDVDAGTVTPATGTLFVSASDQLGDNPTMGGTGGNTTGTVGVITQTNPIPSNVTVASSNAAVACTVTVASRSDGAGDDLVLTTTTTGAAAGNIKATSQTLSSRVTMGETIYAECALDISGMSSVISTSFSLQATIDGTTYLCEPFANQTPTAAQYSQADTGPLVVRTPDFKIPAGTSMTNLIWSLQINFSAAVGGATIKLGRVHVRRQLPYMAW
jgi:hypothetical protein